MLSKLMLAKRIKAGFQKWGFQPTILAQPSKSSFGGLQTFVEPNIPADIEDSGYRFYLAFRPVDPNLDGHQVEAWGLDECAVALGYDPTTNKFKAVDMDDYLNALAHVRRQYGGGGSTFPRKEEALNIPGVIEAVNAIIGRAFE